jgi:hypothetical protein
VRVTKLAGLAIIALTLAACTSVTPQSTPFVSTPITPLPASGALASIATSALPLGSLPAPSAAASAEPATLAPVTPSPTLEPTPTPSPTPTPTPKPTKKPTPTPSPTPPPTKIDLAIYVQTADIPNPWYNDTDYTIPIHVSAAISDIFGAQVKVSIPEEAFSTTYQTGPITAGSEDVHNVTINVPAIGPATLVLQVKTPAGFADVNTSNNKVSIAIEVSLHP